jgi:hypothetical protein
VWTEFKRSAGIPFRSVGPAPVRHIPVIRDIQIESRCAAPGRVDGLTNRGQRCISRPMHALLALLFDGARSQSGGSSGLASALPLTHEMGLATVRFRGARVAWPNGGLSAEKGNFGLENGYAV